MKHKVFVLLPVAALLVAGVTPVLAKNIDQKQFKQHSMLRAHAGENHNQELAGMLGITVDDLKARLAVGKTPVVIAADLGISEADFKQKMQAMAVANIKAHLAQEVAAGKLTQDEVDAKIAQLEKDIQEGKFPMGPMMMKGKGIRAEGKKGIFIKKASDKMGDRVHHKAWKQSIVSQNPTATK